MECLRCTVHLSPVPKGLALCHLTAMIVELYGTQIRGTARTGTWPNRIPA